MEIYRLKDDTSERGRVLRVTDLRQGVKNPERVNVYVDGAFAFSLFVAQVVDLKVKVGRVLTEAELAELKKASEVGKLYQRALEWALTRPRSERETRDYLRKKIYEKKLEGEYVDEVLERLKSKKYVDDGEFAKWWAENRNVRKGASQKKLRMELMQKGVSKEIIDEVLSGRDDTEEIAKIIAKKRDKYDDEKLISYLCRQGFSYELAKEKVLSCGRD